MLNRMVSKNKRMPAHCQPLVNGSVIAWAGALASHAAETGGSPVACAKIDHHSNIGRAFGVGKLKATSWPLQAVTMFSRSLKSEN